MIAETAVRPIQILSLILKEPSFNLNCNSFISMFHFREVDYLNVMAYDFHGTWSKVTSFSGPLYSRASNVQFNQKLSQVYDFMQLFTLEP